MRCEVSGELSRAPSYHQTGAHHTFLNFIDGRYTLHLIYKYIGSFSAHLHPSLFNSGKLWVAFNNASL